MRILFMGTPEFAQAALLAISGSFPNEIVAVVTRQDTPKNRGHAMTPPPVKETALSLGIPVIQPASLKEEAFRETLNAIAPDIIVVAAYGRILPPYVLDYPKFGCINIHASLLPKYRGAAPIQRAILAGEREVGVTIMKMEEGLDTGDMFARGAFSLDGTENFAKIHDRLAALGAELVVMTIRRYRARRKAGRSPCDLCAQNRKSRQNLGFSRAGTRAPKQGPRILARSGCGSHASLRKGKNHRSPFPVRGAGRRARYGIRAFRQRRRRSVCQLRAGQASHSEACPGRQKGNVRRRFYPRTPHR